MLPSPDSKAEMRGASTRSCGQPLLDVDTSTPMGRPSSASWPFSPPEADALLAHLPRQVPQIVFQVLELSPTPRGSGIAQHSLQPRRRRHGQLHVCLQSGQVCVRKLNPIRLRAARCRHVVEPTGVSARCRAGQKGRYASARCAMRITCTTRLSSSMRTSTR